MKFLVVTAAMTLCSLLPLPPYTPDPDPSLYITVYDWGLGGINCNEDCGTTSLTTTGDELLDRTAACPVAWLGHITTTVVTIWGQDFWCIDTFGSPANQRLTRINNTLVYRIDLASRPAAAHPWNNEMVPPSDWSTRWEPMSQFNALRLEWLND